MAVQSEGGHPGLFEIDNSVGAPDALNIGRRKA